MIELVLIACLADTPKNCEQFYLPVVETMSVASCVVLSQFQVVRWLDEHPDWIVKSWKCEMARA